MKPLGLLSIAETLCPRSLNQLVDQAARQVPALLRGRGRPLAERRARGGRREPSVAARTDRRAGALRARPAARRARRGEPAGCADTLDETAVAGVCERGAAPGRAVLAQPGPPVRRPRRSACRCTVRGPGRWDQTRSRWPSAWSPSAGRWWASRQSMVKPGAQPGSFSDAAESRAVVDQAKGVLMHALGCTRRRGTAADAAGLAGANMKVTEVATRIIGSRDGQPWPAARRSAADRLDTARTGPG